MQNEKSFDTGELTLNYLEGPESGQPLVLVHGLTLSKIAWFPLLPGLTQSWHVYAPDLRGHGKSERAADNQYKIADYARDIIAFLKHLGEPVVLMGHSLGAMVSIVVAAQYPEGVSALILLDPPLYSYSEPVEVQQSSTQRFQMVSSILRDHPSYETVVARLRAALPQAPEPFLMANAAMIAGLALETLEPVFGGQSWEGVDLPDALQAIRCPTLLIHGDWDRQAVMRAEDIALFKANCPSAAVIRIPEADHFLKMGEQPDIVLQHVTSFLQPA